MDAEIMKPFFKLAFGLHMVIKKNVLEVAAWRKIFGFSLYMCV